MAKKELTDMQMFLTRFKSVASALVANAEQLGTAVKDCRGKLYPSVGKQYRTYNKSVVHVIAEIPDECNCPRCTANRQQMQMAQSFAKTLGIQLVPVNDKDQDDEEHENIFRVVVLSGGHGIEQLEGEKPGECYSVDRHGIVRGIAQQLSGDCTQDVLSYRLLILAGMSLWKEQKTVCEDQ